MIRKLLSIVFIALLVLPVQAANATGAATSIAMSCESFPRQVFSAPYTGWVMLRNSAGALVSGQSANLTVSGPATLSFQQGNLSDATGLIYYTVTPNLGAVAQDIVVTATLPGSTTGVSCRSQSVIPTPFNTKVTIDSPLQIEPGKTLYFELTALAPNGAPAPRLPITWTIRGLGFIGTPPPLTDAQGKAKVPVLLGSADSGTVVATATVNYGSFQATVVRSVLVQPMPVAPAVAVDVFSSEQKVVVVVKNARGGSVAVKIGSKWYRYTATSDVHVFEQPATATSHQVSVWVNGELQNIATLDFPGFQKPTPSPTATPRVTTDPGASAPSRTITCRSGSNVLSVTGAAPKCPSGFRQSGQPMAGNAKVVVCRKSGYTIRMAAPLTKCPAGYRR